MISPAITAIIIAVLAAVAFTGGFAVSDWRSAAEIRRLNSDNAMLSASNNKCASDIQSVRAAMDALTTASMTREKNAAVAMRHAGVPGTYPGTRWLCFLGISNRATRFYAEPLLALAVALHSSGDRRT